MHHVKVHMNAVAEAAPQVQSTERASVTRDRAARKRSRPVRSSIPAGATGTPGSMEPKSNRAAVSTPKEIDFVQLVKEVVLIQTKNAVGTTRMVSNKGKQHVFALCCKAVVSHRGLAPVERLENGRVVMVPARLDDADVAAIKQALNDVWLTALREFLVFGGDTSTSNIRIVKNQPVTRMILPENSTVTDKDGNRMHDLDVALKLQAVVTRKPNNTQEAIFVATMGQERAEKRLTSMEATPGKYDRDALNEQKKLIHVHAWKVGQLRDIKALEDRRALAVEALDKELAGGKLTQDEYAAARLKIETAVS